jgi:hypothetical protein
MIKIIRSSMSEITINRKELLQMAHFMLKHDHDHNKNIILVVEANHKSGIGEQIIVQCGECQVTEDVTDYSSW